MKRFLRDHAVPAVLVLVKILTTLRTAADTYAVSHNWLDVLLIDVVFLGLWLLLAYGGDNQYAKRVRLFATGGVWAMYIMMLVIGWSAHHGVVAVATRMAGGLGLLLDTWDYIASVAAPALKRWRDQLTQPPDVTLHGQALIQRRMRKSLNRSAAKLQSHMDTFVFEQMRERLPEVILGRMDRVTVEPLPTLALPASTVRQTVVDRWTTVASLLPTNQRIRRTDVEALAGCKRSLANDLIAYGLSTGRLREISRGVYEYHG